MAGTSFRGEKLVGKSNYIEWQINAKLYLEINGFFPYIDRTASEPNKSLYYNKENEPKSDELGVRYYERFLEYQRNSNKALGALKSIISTENVERFKDRDTCYSLWDAITKTYGESNLELVNRYFNKIIESNYSSYKSIDEYTSNIQAASVYLKELGYELPKIFIVCTIFKGLPSSFDSFASRKYEEISSDLKDLNLAKLIAELISEEARMNSNLEANKVSKKNNQNKPFCKHCNKRGHLESKCYIKFPELKDTSKDTSNDNKSKSNKTKNKDKNKKDQETKSESNKVIMTVVNDLNTSYYASNINNTNKIILDSGASEHFTPNKDWLLDYKPVINKYITVADGNKLPLLGIGKIPIINKSSNIELLITEVNYVPAITTTLISTKALTNKGWAINFTNNKAEVVNKKANITISANWLGNAYYLDIKVNYSLLEPLVYKVDSSLKELKLDLIHKRLNHLSSDYLVKTINNTTGYTLTTNSSTKLSNCDSCHYSKMTKNISYLPLKSPEEILSYFDLDIAGPFRILGLRGERYFITFTCRKTRATWVYPIKYKSDAIDKLIELYNLIQNQFKINIKGLHLDNAKEFTSTKWDIFCKDKGIYNDYTSPYSPEQNGIAERLNRYILERLIAITSQKAIPLILWPYIIKAIVHIKNRTYNSIIKTTPYEAITKTKPDISYIKILGSLCYTLIPKEVRTKQDLSKLANKANKGILVGWESSNNYLVYIPDSKKVISTRDLIIKEELSYKNEFLIEEDYSLLLEEESIDFDFITKSTSNNKRIEPEASNTDNNNNKTSIEVEENDSTSDSESESSDDSDDESSVEHNRNSSKNSKNTTSENTSESTSKNTRYNLRSNPKSNLSLTDTSTSIYNLASHAYLTSKIEGNSNNNSEKIIINKTKDSIISEPKSYEEAISINNPYRDYWIKAMQKELDTLEYNNTWSYYTNTSSNNNIKPLKTRWTYKLKESYNSDIVEFKARFVAKGFEQLYGRDYIESFAAVIKQMSWKLVFALAILNNYYIYKIDMVSAFTQGGIDTQLYLIPPKGLNSILKLNNSTSDLKYLLLNKALYGLKQSARIWHFTLIKVLKELGFKPLYADSCIFINKNTSIIICIYVDDLAILGLDKSEIKSLINSIKEHFNIKDLGPISDFLGIEVNIDYTEGILKLSQTKYINKILEKYNLLNCNPIYTPVDTKLKLVPNIEQASKEEIKEYQGIIGSLLYLVLGTRIDITYIVIKLSRFSSNPSKEHFTAIKRVLRYLSGTKEYSLTYKRSGSSYISSYCDSDYAGDTSTAKSTLGYIFYLAGGPISWRSKLQSIVAQSTTEAEYIAINSTAKEAIYIISLAKELGFYKQEKFPIYTDNNGALLLGYNPVFHERTKHIAVKYHYIRNLILKGTIDLIYIPTKEQKADGLTKALDKIKFKRFLEYLNFI